MRPVQGEASSALEEATQPVGDYLLQVLRRARQRLRMMVTHRKGGLGDEVEDSSEEREGRIGIVWTEACTHGNRVCYQQELGLYAQIRPGSAYCSPDKHNLHTLSLCPTPINRNASYT